VRQKDDQKIDLFFNSTLALVSRVGLVGLTIPGIAKHAGVATGTLYLYFKNKEDLIQALFKDVKKHFSANIFVGYHRGMSVETGLRIIWENSLRYSVSHYSQQIFFEQYNISPYRKEQKAMDLADAAMEPFMELVTRGQRESQLKPDREFLIPQFFFGFVQQIAARLQENHQWQEVPGRQVLPGQRAPLGQKVPPGQRASPARQDSIRQRFPADQQPPPGQRAPADRGAFPERRSPLERLTKAYCDMTFRFVWDAIRL
jgi:AcrR family transcriptional regulator